jgi:sacsin
LREVKEIIKDAWTLPEDERKKVIKRLYKKWHPDKNHGNEAVATKVFQFIKQIVFRMESGQDIDTDSSSVSARGRNSVAPTRSTFACFIHCLPS